ncbi:apiosidase-like domain-containing protein [Isoptericola sp. NPDC055881]
MARPVVAATTSAANAAGASAAPAVPSGVASGSLLIAYVFGLWGTPNPPASAMTIPSGWVLGGWDSITVEGVYGGGLGWFYKRATAADTGTYTFTANSLGGSPFQCSAVVHRVTNATGSGSPFGAFFAGSAAVPSVVGAIAPGSDDWLALAGVVAQDLADILPAAGWTQVVDVPHGTAARQGVFSAPADTAGVPTSSWASGASFAHAYAATIQPAAVAVAGAASASLPRVTATITGSVTMPTTTGTLTAALPRLSAAASGTATTVAQPHPRTIAGRHFLDQNGQPVYLRGDTPWYIIGGAPADWPTYFANRAAYGINTCYVMCLPELDITDATTWDGSNVHALTTPGNYSTVNPTWVARVKSFVEMAATYGVTVWFLVGPANMISTTAQATAWGTAWGTALKDYPNVLFGYGVDWLTEQWAAQESIVAAVRTAVRAAGALQPFTVQLYQDQTSSDNAAWAGQVDFEATYTYQQYAPLSRRAYALNNGPVVFAEGNFEGENNEGGAATTSETLRRVLGAALTNGTVGVQYGRDGVYNPPQDGTEATWTSLLPSTMLAHQKVMADAVAAIPWHRLVPDTAGTFLTSGAGTPPATGTQTASRVDPLESAYATAAVSSDGSAAVLYAPTSRAMTVDLARLGANSTVRRLDPTTGASTTLASSGSLAAPGNNAAGQSDWLYVFEADPFPAIEGTLGGPLPRVTGATAGAVRITGGIAGALPAASGASAGSVTVTGTITASTPTVTSMAAASVVVIGSLAATAPRVTASVNGEGVATGTLAATLPAVTADLDATVTITGTLTTTLPRTTSALGGAVEGVIGGTLTATLPKTTAVAAGTLSVAGTLAATLPSARAALAGSDVPDVEPELVIARGPYGNPFRPSGPHGSTFTVSSPRG